MFPEAVQQKIASVVRGKVTSIRSIGGGCIANASRIDTTSGPLFLKWGDPPVAYTFPAEAHGLRELKKAESSLAIPEVLAVSDGEPGRPGCLILEWIEKASQGVAFWETFAQGLAELHRFNSDRYGFDADNFIGRLPQQNSPAETWTDFFVTNRLEPQVQLARRKGRWRPDWEKPLANLCNHLDRWLPDRPEPSLVHGDLWGGNYMVTTENKACLIDPAAYYGHREVDLAMAQLFGGFDRRFFAAYQEAWPLEPGFDERKEIYNLYHLINHLNHFGVGYAGSVSGVFDLFGSC